jgi:hypothetical protein
MPFTPAELAMFDATIGALVQRRRPPEHLRDQLDLELEVDGHKVRIFTVRPLWSDPNRTVRSGVAQFTYTRTKDTWKLYWMRRDGKWHPWDPDENTGTLAELVRVVDDDRRGGFWG